MDWLASHTRFESYIQRNWKLSCTRKPVENRVLFSLSCCGRRSRSRSQKEHWAFMLPLSSHMKLVQISFFFFHTSNWRSGCTKRPVVSNSFRFGVLLELCYVIFVLADQTVNRLYITSGWPTQIARLDLYNKIIFLCICIFAFLIVSFSVQFRYIAFGIVQWFLLNIFFVIFFTSQTYIVFLLVFVDIDLLNEKTGCSECLDWFE